MQSQVVLMVFMLVNGQPVGETMRIEPLYLDCRAEMAVVNGMNRALADKGIYYMASCERLPRGK